MGKIWTDLESRRSLKNDATRIERKAKQITFSKFCFSLLLLNKIGPFFFFITFRRPMKSGSSRITDDIQHSGWITMNLLNTSQSWSWSKRRLRWMFGVQQTHYSFLNPSETITVEKHPHGINEMHPKSRRLCLAFVNWKGSILLHANDRPHVT